MKKIIVEFLKEKIQALEMGYAQNYVAKKELEEIEESARTSKHVTEMGACDFNMTKGLEKIELYKKFLKKESKGLK